MTTPITAKRVSESAVHDQVYHVFPNDLNPNGTVFGGLVMSMLDRLSSIVARLHSGKVCVTASVDSMNFLAPARHGDILRFMVSVNRVWRTSMEVGAKVMAEDFRTGNKRHIVSAYFTFVAVDDNQQPIEIPQLIVESPAEKRRYEEADIRRERRRLGQKEREQRRELFMEGKGESRG